MRGKKLDGKLARSQFWQRTFKTIVITERQSDTKTKRWKDRKTRQLRRKRGKKIKNAVLSFNPIANHECFDIS